MWKWLNKLFKKKEDYLDMEEQNNGLTNEVSNAAGDQTALKKRKHKLEIQVYEADYTDVPDGSPPKWRPVRSDPALGGGGPVIVEVADKRELTEVQKQYAMCDQKIKVIREIDPFDDVKPAPSAIPQNNQAIPVDINTLQQGAVRPESAAYSHVLQQRTESQQLVTKESIVRPKPKIVTIGDMQVKYDGDKVYQKQWVKLNSNEATNFRIVNDSNNKIVPLNGKHIECKRWVIVEEDSNEPEEDVMNGVGD